MKSTLLLAAALLVSAPALGQSTPSPADQTLQALYGEYWSWQVREYGMIERADGSTDEGPTIASATAAAQKARAAAAAEFRARLDKIDNAALSPTEKVNAAVLGAALTETIEDARFFEWEMPFVIWCEPAAGPVIVEATR